jgi:hypothetical protein
LIYVFVDLIDPVEGSEESWNRREFSIGHDPGDASESAKSGDRRSFAETANIGGTEC